MTDEQENYNSLGYFSLARGLGMLFIIAGHSMGLFGLFYVPDGDQAIFAGAGKVFGGAVLAMFFMISGFGFYACSPKRCLSTQSKLLLKPYIQVTAAILLTKVILSIVLKRSFLHHGGELVLTFLLGLNAVGGGSLGGLPIDSISSLWFVLALFGSWIIYNSICQLKNRKLQWVLIIACVILGWVLTEISNVWPFCLPMLLLAVGYLAAGHEIRKRDLLNKKLPGWCWALLLVITGVCVAFGNVDILSCYWKLGLVDVAGSFCIGFLLMRLYARPMELGCHGPVVRAVETVGFYSMGIFCAHGYEKMVIPWHLLERIFPGNPELCTVLCFVCRCVMIGGLLALSSRIRRGTLKRKTIVIEP